MKSQRLGWHFKRNSTDNLPILSVLHTCSTMWNILMPYTHTKTLSLIVMNQLKEFSSSGKNEKSVHSVAPTWWKVKFYSPQNISFTSEQNWTAAFSSTAQGAGTMFQNITRNCFSTFFPLYKNEGKISQIHALSYTCDVIWSLRSNQTGDPWMESPTLTPLWLKHEQGSAVRHDVSPSFCGI